MPITIVRPSIVMPTYKEPVRSWMSSAHGVTGAVLSSGIVHAMMADKNTILDIVPGDYVINALIASCFATRNRHETSRDIKIYNYVSSPRNPFSDLVESTEKHGRENPFHQAMWFPSSVVTKCYYYYIMCVFLLHVIPAAMLDLFATVVGENPQMLKLYKKVHDINMTLKFAMRNIKYTDVNTQNLCCKLSKPARVVFPVDIARVNWEEYSQTHNLGIKSFAYDEKMVQLQIVISRTKRLYFVMLVGIVALFISAVCRRYIS